MFQKNIRARAGERLTQNGEKWFVQADEDQPVADGEKQLTRNGEEQFVQDSEEQFAPDEAERFTPDVEQRLSAYYGPALPAHPLPEAAWLRLRDQLSVSAPARRSRLRVAVRTSQRSRRIVPIELQQIYATLLLQTNYRRPSPDLSVQLSPRPVQPRVRTGVLGRGRIGLVLPRDDWQTLQKTGLDMLLAAGLARCSGVSRPLFLLPRTLFAVSLLLVLAALPFTSVDRRAVWIFLLAVACCLVSGRLLIWQQRALAFRGDRVAVQWLGRERVCQGLHLLAERGQPERRPAWGEPSLVERISRVCGTPLPSKDKRLTLVG